MKPRLLQLVRDPMPVPSRPPPVTDAVAIARMAAGDVQALGDLYDRHGSALLRFALRTVGSHDADDLVQGTFLKAFLVAPSYEARGSSARSWLYGIMAKLMQERRRSLLRLGRALLRLGAATAVQSVPPPSSLRDLEKGLFSLAEPKRVVLVLAEIEGYTCEEIAEILRVPVGTIWTRLHHARRQLRTFYGEGSR